MKKINLYEPKFGREELKAVKEVLDSGILTQGPKVAELEQQFANYVGAKYAVAVNSCTSAIFLCLQYKKIEKGIEEVVIPSITFVSVANAIVNSGLRIRFHDEIFVGEHYSLLYTDIIDSAHWLEKGCYVKKSLMCFSFYPTKLLGGAEGGMIATDSKEACDWLKKARANGMNRKGMFDWNYVVEMAGWKMNMTDIQAAIALVRLAKLDIYNEERRKIRDFYNEELGMMSQSLHIYPIFVKDRKNFIKKMVKENIYCSVNFKPIHLQPVYQDAAVNLPKSEDWGKREVSIPLHENLTTTDANKIIKEVKKNGYFH